MKSLLISSLLLSSTFLIFSCGDGNPGDGDTEGLSVTINSPDNNSTFNMGEIIVLSYTVKDDIDITTIAYSTQGQLGTDSVMASELSGDVTEFSGEFMIVADAAPGTYEITLSATDEEFNSTVESEIAIIIQ